MHAGDHGRAVVELDILAALAHVRWVDLEVEPDDQAVPGGERVVRQDDTTVLVGLAAGIGRHRVFAHGFPPARVEDQLGLADLLVRGHLNSNLEDQAATEPSRRSNGEISGYGMSRGSGRALTKDIQ